MENFEVINPTRILFGKNQLSRLPELLKSYKAQKVMLVYGGGSVSRIGLLDKIMSELLDFKVVTFGGVEANPDYSTLMQAVDLAKEENIDFILAVGGGSVIDGVKFLSGAINYNGDPWDVLLNKKDCAFTSAVSFGTILTLPATGSEANSGAVISRRELNEKRTMGGPLFFPKFSFCDPTVVASIPKRQLANGIVDAFMHTLEQYITYPSNNLLQEREAEGVLSTLIEISNVVDHPDDYKLASNLMHCATHALNGNLRCGVPTDWTTHMIGHELTALFSIDHARTLAIIAPRLWEYKFIEKQDKLTQYGKRVWNLSGDNEAIAREAISKTESFFNSLGLKTRLSENTDDFEGCEKIIRAIFEERNWTAMGERKSIYLDDIEAIIKASF
ncbi:iron-containing alcohol dehydrogenase [Crocinitomicaceae bacterium]|nr:iron-containing alcohol dehydrogenase [Crocinitomicaceae bacterium]